jgi:hypothetical protein
MCKCWKCAGFDIDTMHSWKWCCIHWCCQVINFCLYLVIHVQMLLEAVHGQWWIGLELGLDGNRGFGTKFFWKDPLLQNWLPASSLPDLGEPAMMYLHCRFWVLKSENDWGWPKTGSEGPHYCRLVACTGSGLTATYHCRFSQEPSVILGYHCRF